MTIVVSSGGTGATCKPVWPGRLASTLTAFLLVATVTGCKTVDSAEHGQTQPTAQARSSTYTADTLAGEVVDDHGPIADAVVRVQTTVNETITDAEGRFALTGLSPNEPVAITAWAPGYFIGGGEEHLPGTEVQVHLEPHAETDDPNYDWISAFADGGDESNCENCHSDPSDPDSPLPFDEWLHDAHSGSAVNERFLTMYSGTDVHGNQSPFARFGDSRRFSGTDPLVPASDQPYYGPGFKLDYPYVAGSCSACHLPADHFSDTYGADPTTAHGVGAEGATCDLCHKVWDVHLEPDTGLPHRDMPGILSYEFLRPHEGHQFFAGPLDDVAPGEDTYSPIQRQSEYCAGCHYGMFWDTTVYNSFGEWSDSPYSDPETGQTCQDCHMPRGKTTHFVDPAKGGLERDPHSISSHDMLGIADEAFMRNAVSVDVDAKRFGAEIGVDVKIVNDNTGHHVPTDSPLRHLILLVRASDAAGEPLLRTSGPTVPEWAGVGDPSEGYYAGLTGTAYAKILQEFRSELFPTGAYWNPTRVLSDNRIPAMGSDTSSYRFVAHAEGESVVDVRLLHRRAFIDLADQKGWSDSDLEMYRQTIVVSD